MMLSLVAIGTLRVGIREMRANLRSNEREMRRVISDDDVDGKDLLKG